jgi:membrane protease YdiL (CAAX protease family)
MTAIVEAVLKGMLVLVAGTIPRNIVYLANMRYLRAVPWAAFVTLLYLWCFWRYLRGWGSGDVDATRRRERLRATPLAWSVWRQALIAGFLGIAALVVALRLLNRFVTLPEQQVPDFSQVPMMTVGVLLLVSSLNAGVVEEAAFRGYMQGPIERQAGPVVAILVTGVMFAVAHLDFSPVLLPYYLAVAAVYGLVTYLTGSILPAIVLHTVGNIYSNTDLWLRGRAEWQALSRAETQWADAAGASVWPTLVAEVVLLTVTVFAYRRLATLTLKEHQAPARST